MGLDVSFGTGASQDHPVGSPQLTIPTGQSHISQLFLISQVFKGGEVKVFSDILMLEKSEVNVFRIVKCLVTALCCYPNVKWEIRDFHLSTHFLAV